MKNRERIEYSEMGRKKWNLENAKTGGEGQRVWEYHDTRLTEYLVSHLLA